MCVCGCSVGVVAWLGLGVMGQACCRVHFQHLLGVVGLRGVWDCGLACFVWWVVCVLHSGCEHLFLL